MFETVKIADSETINFTLIAAAHGEIHLRIQKKRVFESASVEGHCNKSTLEEDTIFKGTKIENPAGKIRTHYQTISENFVVKTSIHVIRRSESSITAWPS